MSSNRFLLKQATRLWRSVALFALGMGPGMDAADQPQWGVAWSRNMRAAERGLPESFDANTGAHIKWVAKLGSESHSTPVVAGGRVFIGTNNDEPRDAKHQGDRGVLMCFDEKEGKLLWQLVVAKRTDDQYFDWPKSGISSPATVDADRVYIVDNRGAVLCLDPHGMANGNDGPFVDEAAYATPHDAPPPSFAPRTSATDRSEGTVERGEKDGAPASAAKPISLEADILWMFDMPSQAGIWPHDAAHSSILVDGDFLYVNSGTGVDNSHRVIRTPNAPSLIVLNKKTGAFVARDEEKIAPQIFHSTWSSPSLGFVGDARRIFFAAGDGVLRAFDPVTPGGEAKTRSLKKIWQFDPDPTAPKENVHRFTSNRQIGPSNIYGMPVVLDGRVYVAGGGDLFWGKNEAWLKCIDIRGNGDVTSSAEIWSYPLNRHVVATPAIADGLIFITDVGRTLHCVDATSGKPVWTHGTQSEFWASPFVADGKVFVGNRKGEFFVFRAAREKELLSTFQFKAPISATVCAANGVVYIGTMTHLYAVGL